MRLLQRTGQYYVLFSILIFALWSGGLFLALHYILDKETDEYLEDARVVMHQQLTDLDSLPTSITLLDNLIEIKPINEFKPFQEFSDTLIWNPIEVEHKLAYRKLTYHEIINDRPYRISLNHSKLDMEELLTTIAIAVLTILGLLLLTVNIFNRSLSLNLWKPFYKTIEQIKGFSFDKKIPLSPPTTKIDEFNVLHQAVHEMTSKALSDYQSLKRFTENASHEIQNPLAIIKSKIELLIQDENLNENERLAIQDIQIATSRLSRLNQSLLLLARIENRQYADVTKLNLKTILENQIDILNPMLFSKNLSVTNDLEEVYQTMDPTLAEVLINNLLGNAIKHNLQDGKIKVHLNKEKLQICNSGAILTIPSDTLFQRFHKGTESAPSLGLGLAIVKEICTCYGFEARYDYKDKEHCLSIIF